MIRQIYPLLSAQNVITAITTTNQTVAGTRCGMLDIESALKAASEMEEERNRVAVALSSFGDLDFESDDEDSTCYVNSHAPTFSTDVSTNETDPSIASENESNSPLITKTHTPDGITMGITNTNLPSVSNTSPVSRATESASNVAPEAHARYPLTEKGMRQYIRASGGRIAVKDLMT
eukprot:gene44522-55391_t